MAAITLTERLLSDAGGWQALKEARSIHAAGRVADDARYEPPLLEGRVREGEREYRAGLRIESASKIENLCGCRISQRDGAICAHSLAVGLQVMRPAARAASSNSGSATAAQNAPPAATHGHAVIEPGRQLGAAPRFHLAIEGSLRFLAAELNAIRDQHTAPVQRGAAVHPAEMRALEIMRECGFSPEKNGTFTLRGEPAVVAFFARDLPRLKREWEVTLGPRFETLTSELQRVEPQLEVRSSGEDWFDLSVELAIPSGERFSGPEIQRLLQSGRYSTSLRNGKTAIFNAELLEELEQLLVDCQPVQDQPGRYRIGKRHAPYLQNVAQAHGMRLEANEGWKKWAEMSMRPERLQPIALGALESLLREYQKHGVYWLTFLGTNNMGGILADEMGLGKTVQALAFLAALPGTSLVVCPSALLTNWEREAQKFFPGIRSLVIQGPSREPLFAQIAQAQLVITSYALLRRDIEHYAAFSFSGMVLDEAQHIKNPESQNAQAALRVRAECRAVLTGTPIENSLRDIWSLMQFLMPGYLGSRAEFKARFEDPITREPGGAEQQRLVRRLRPFVLRRTKRAVATELPDKIEQVAYCELVENQRTIYNELLRAARQQTVEVAGAQNRNQARMRMLTALLRLRQACCDVRLLDLDLPAKGATSGKLELLGELLAEAVDDNHRVLVFSQFVSMLKLLRENLTENGFECAYLDGQTRDRQAVVDAFQSGNAPVFLISLKAGGVGLNITAADTVIHYDPWWNPAVEAQATDRAHRIGQTKVVTSYKLIARETIEEKILALQEKKRGLVEAAIESEQPLMEGLTTNDLEALLLE